jgi:hypothetical protein
MCGEPVKARKADADVPVKVFEKKSKKPGVFIRLEQEEDTALLHLVDNTGEHIPGGNILYITEHGLELISGINGDAIPFKLTKGGFIKVTKD